MKCTINDKNEITSFWDDGIAPENSFDCDQKEQVTIGEGPPQNISYFYKLVDGKVATTEAGNKWLAQNYARNRQVEYPSIGDQLDMQYHDQLNGTTTWKDAIAKVKADNPKEAE